MKPENTAPLPEKPDASTQQDWDWHYRTLQRLRERLVEDRDVQQQDSQQPRTENMNDLADSGSNEFDHDVAISLLSNEASALQEVDAALRRIEQGTYGVCEETGQRIPDERLRAVPWTRYTKEVQERLEKKV